MVLLSQDKSDETINIGSPCLIRILSFYDDFCQTGGTSSNRRRIKMGWLDFFSADESSGDTGKVSDVKVNIKTDKGGNVSDILVNRSGGNSHKNHSHYAKVNKGKSYSSKKGKG